MFVLTETYKALHNSNNMVFDTILPCMIAAVCLVLLVVVVIEGRKK